MNPVWIIDDDRSIRWVFEKALTREEIAFKSFGSAAEALASLDAGAPLSACLGPASVAWRRSSWAA